MLLRFHLVRRCQPYVICISKGHNCFDHKIHYNGEANTYKFLLRRKRNILQLRPMKIEETHDSNILSKQKLER